MDDTPIDTLVSELAAADPAEGADLADAVAEALARALDEVTQEANPAPEA